MTEANPVLLRLYKASNKAKNPDGTKSSRISFKNDIIREFKGEDVVVNGVFVKKEEAAMIKAVGEIEEEILRGYISGVAGLCKKYSFKVSTLEISDFISEGCIALIRSIYYFNPNESNGGAEAFSTYLFPTVKRHLIRVFQTNRPIFSGFSTTQTDLMNKYNNIILSSKEDLSFEEVVKKMGLTEKQRIKFLQALKNEGRMTSRENNQDLLSTVAGKEEEPIDEDMMAAINATKDELSEWDLKVLEACAVGEIGWKLRLSRSTINPKTKKPYSPEAVAVALERIREKVLRNYEGSERIAG